MKYKYLKKFPFLGNNYYTKSKGIEIFFSKKLGKKYNYK